MDWKEGIKGDYYTHIRLIHIYMIQKKMDEVKKRKKEASTHIIISVVWENSRTYIILLCMWARP